MKLRLAFAVVLVLGSIVDAGAQTPGPARRALSAADCERVAKLALPTTAVMSAEVVAAGTFSGPPAVVTGLSLAPFYKSLPAFCRVQATARPSPDSNIRIEVWMPASGWNGKLRGVGNGGFAGEFDYRQIGMAVLSGYAGVATDTGHAGSPIDATWALGHPEKVVDFGHRAIHEMTTFAKEAVRSAFGAGPERSYFAGCSDGGREALMEAQRYPADYDGIVAGAPANDWTHLLTMAVVDSQALLTEPASYIPPERIPAIASAVRAACDEQDGVKDSIVNDPRACRFDPSRLTCRTDADVSSCLTTEQIATLKKLYDGLHDPKGNSIYPGYSPGGEEGPGGWSVWITGPAPGKSLMFQFGTGYYSNMVYEKPDWDYKTFTQDEGVAAAERKTGAVLNATSADLKAFMDRGGKLILYHGWADPAIPPLSTVRYYENVVNTMGQARANSFVRLFMMPGVQHCGGGPAPDFIGQNGAMTPGDPLRNVNAALEQWVERGVAPATLIATKVAPATAPEKSAATRLLCPYPQLAKYKGSGDTNDAANFACVARSN